MAVCTWCDREMRDHVSCTVTAFHRGDTEYRLPPNRTRHDCWDCGAPSGGHHHPGCDQADCPACGRQMLSCGCRFNEDGPDEDDELDDPDDLDDLDVARLGPLVCLRPFTAVPSDTGWTPTR